MKKALQCIVLLGTATGVAHATTSVTLYGLVEAGIRYTDIKVSHGDEWSRERQVHLADFNQSSNRWGLRGSEDLGNGTSVIFSLENGFSLGTGHARQGGRLFGREAIMGLTGESWGTVTVGRQSNVADDFTGSFDPFSTGFRQAGMNTTFGDFGAYMEQSIKYQSPEMSGFKFGLSYTGSHKRSAESSENGAVTKEDRDMSRWVSTGAGYERGPVSVGASYDRFRSDARVSGVDQAGKAFDNKNSGTTVIWNLFGAYDLGGVKLYAGYGRIHGSLAHKVVSEADVGPGLNGELAHYATDPASSRNYFQTAGFRQHAWLLGATAPVGDAGKIMFSYQGNRSRNTDDEYQGIKGRLNVFSLGYTHQLSKRTNLNAVVSYGAGKLAFADPEKRDAKLRSTQLGVGLRHRF